MPSVRDIIRDGYLQAEQSGPADSWIIRSSEILRELTNTVTELRSVASRLESALSNIDRVRDAVREAWETNAELAVNAINDDDKTPFMGLLVTHPATDITIEVMFALDMNSKPYWRAWFEGCVLVGPKVYTWSGDMVTEVIDFVYAIGHGRDD